MDTVGMYKGKDYFMQDLNIGDKVIVGMQKDVKVGVITDMENNDDFFWLDIKMQGTDAIISRRNDQVIKINE